MPELQFAMRKAAVHRTAMGTGRRGVVPAPVGGWNTRDPLSAMRPIHAVQLENYFPDQGRITTRRGSKDYADTGDSNAVETLFNHLNGTTDKLFAFTSSKVYDVTDPDSVTEAVTSGVTEGRWRGANLNGNSVFVNGTDAPLRIDATGAWVAHGFTGITAPASLTQVAVHQNRLWFLEKDTPNMWYGALNAITGSLTKFPLGLVDEAGGNAVALGSITLDTGEGVDDLLAVYMSRGSVIVYRGTDPGQANSWRLAGVFRLAPPVGDNPLVKFGGDLVAITADGFIPLLQFLGAGREQQHRALSHDIGPTVSAAVREHGDLVGWQAVVHAPANYIAFNVPRSAVTFDQYVQNLQTKAWCRFTGMNARCWATWKDRLYFGDAAGKVVQADVGGTDNGDAIRAVSQGAFNYFGSPYDKYFRMIRSHIESEAGSSQVLLGAVTDFSPRPPDLAPAAISSSGTKWDTEKWDTFKWGAGVARSRTWRRTNQRGTSLSTHIVTRTVGRPVSLFATDVMYDQVTGAVFRR